MHYENQSTLNLGPDETSRSYREETLKERDLGNT